MEVKTTSLNSDLDGEIYIHRGYIEIGQEDKVCKLNKFLCELKQAPRQ